MQLHVILLPASEASSCWSVTACMVGTLTKLHYLLALTVCTLETHTCRYSRVISHYSTKYNVDLSSELIAAVGMVKPNILVYSLV